MTAITASRTRLGSTPEISPPAIAPTSDGGAIHRNRRQSIRPPRQCAALLVSAETPLIATLAPAPAAGEVASSTTSGSRRLPSTSPTSPPTAATVNAQAASAISSSAPSINGRPLVDGVPVRPRGGFILVLHGAGVRY